MLYQTQHSILPDKATLESGNDLNFPNHIHNSFEIIIATDGEMEITVQGIKYTISGNECVLVFPNQLHEIKTPSHAEHTILIFSPQLVKTFGNRFENFVPKNNKFYLNDFYIDKISRFDNKKSLLELKGLLYSICGEFDKNAEYTKFKGDDQNLLLKIFNFVAENYKGKCTLYELARRTNYSYVYLSKHFSKNTGISYTEYVCRFRINEACYLLTSTSNTVLDIAYECGFDCLRSFNRSFKSITGISPSEYRKQKISRNKNALV
ncbi:MAG: helix-turn-helix transcriptional regulator [Clostridia bacterium]|nr:helix-turn-helix transcriptional regulator [Clostridia bacterium]